MGESSYHTYLCVVDSSDEFHKALYFACRRAVSTGGRVSLFYPIESSSAFEHWVAVSEIMKEERHEEAAYFLQNVADAVERSLNCRPEIFMREGDVVTELLKVINDAENSISVLVLGAAVDQDSPGPIVSTLVSKMSRYLTVPMMIVPGNLTYEHIDELVQ